MKPWAPSAPDHKAPERHGLSLLVADPFAFDLAYWQYQVLQWGLGLATLLMVKGFGHRPWHRAIGWGILSVPVWGTLVGIADSISTLADPTSVFGPLSPRRMSQIAYRKLLEDLGYLLIGYAVWSWDQGRIWDRRPRQIAEHLRRVGWPTGGRTELQSLWAGYLAFPVLAIVSMGLYQAASGIETLQNGDESSAFSRMTPFHLVILSLAAGFGEEVFYRGFVQTVLARRMPILAAITLQAVFFGFAHAGYGTWAHVLGPVLFGFAAGVVAWRWGLWAATLLHVLIDVYAFGAAATAGYPWIGPLLVWALLANAVVSAAWLARRIVLRARQPGPPNSTP